MMRAVRAQTVKASAGPLLVIPHDNRGVLRRILVEKPEGAKTCSVLPERR